jgi:hypothetical protein
LSTNILYAFLFYPFVLHTLPSPWLDVSNYVWLIVQVMKLFIMRFYPASRHFVSSDQIFSSAPNSQHSQSTFLPECMRASFTPIQNHRQNYSFIYSDFYVLRQ